MAFGIDDMGDDERAAGGGVEGEDGIRDVASDEVLLRDEVKGLP